MSIQVVIGGEQWFDFATNRGAGDFTRWVDSLDESDFPLLVHLTDWGWVNEIGDLLEELDRAVQSTPPEESVKNTIDSFRQNLMDRSPVAESVMLTNGLTSQNVDDEEWWINGEPQ